MPPQPNLTNAPVISPVVTPYDHLTSAFITDVRNQLKISTGEIALRNTTVIKNDGYVYGNLLERSLKIPVGHDFTPVNWLRRTVEIHRTQTMADGFTVGSSYHGQDVDEAFDPDAKPQIIMQNNHLKDNAEARNKIFDSIMRDNGGHALFARMVENASAVGTSVLKAWYDEDKKKYCLEMIEALENFYTVWSANDFRHSDLDAYVWQVSKEKAVSEYDLPENVPTSPLGMPLTILTSINVSTYLATQPMVTVMEICGKVQGWKSENGVLSRCHIGQETPVNAIIAGNILKKLEDEPKYMPKYYIFRNKQVRRQPWGLPDITDSAININQTYIETLSDWRTVQSKVNFPKFKAFGFGMDVQMPIPKARTVEMIGLGEGQDIVPIQQPNSEVGSELDFMRALDELKSAYVREVGISRNLFDMPDSNSNSNQAMITAMKSVSDQVDARRQLWEPIIKKVFEDALDNLALWDDNIKDLVQGEEDWYIRVTWPPSMRKDDPTFQTMVMNRLIGGTISFQSFLERLGENAKEEIDRLSDEMENPITAAIHGKMFGLLAEYKIAGPPTAAPPVTHINLTGVLTPEQEANLAHMHQFGDGPVYDDSAGPQGQLGVRAMNDAADTGAITGQGYPTGQPIIQGGQPTQGGPATQGPAPQQPQMMTPPGNNQPGQQPVSQPQSGQPATPNSPQGNLNQSAQRHGKK